MAKGAKGRPSRRVTPKERATPVRPAPSARYTPPTPRSRKVSPRWVPALMAVFLAAGAVVIVINYLGLLPASPTNWYLLLGLALITAGFVTATQWR
jgi:hypothetical protein